ncbi:MAG TPA: carboxypeptidase regulatory-like domain-containing protein [Terracidiphilus sp.]|nr:carboxypeptidase regulatory-like domain-containing protein [Terracidiphilus sp.]
MYAGLLMKFSSSLPLVVALLWPSMSSSQQTAHTQNISGLVHDPSGAAIVGARVDLDRSDGKTVGHTASNGTGGFQFKNVPFGSYEVVVSEAGFQETRVSVTCGPESRQQVRIVMPVATVKEDVTVVGTETSATISTEIGQNQSGNAIDSNAIDRLPIFDQDYLTTMSRFLDPDSSGTNGTTLVVNGVEANGPGVTASAIQSVKINQNPYTALYSRPGRARIEITTKGGTPQVHGSVNFLYRNSIFDAKNAFAVTKPPEERTYFEGSVTGPLSRGKKTTFLFGLDVDKDDQQAIINAAGPAGPINGNVLNPTDHYFISGRAFHDYEQGNQFWVGYSFEHETVKNMGVGGTVLPEAGTNTLFFEHEVNVGHVYVVSSKTANQLHFLVGHYDNQIHSINEAPQINVSGAFTGGGAQADFRRTEYHFDGTDIVTYTSGKHEIKFGVDVPDISRRAFDDWTNQLGTYSFAGLTEYSAAQPFSYLLQRGEGHVNFLETTFAGIFEDNYRPAQNLSLSVGIRYYWQNYFHEVPWNFGPRASFAWAPTAKSKTVVRGGAGFFFDRTGPSPISDLLHFNGVTLKRFIVDSPSYPITPAELAGVPTGIVELDPRLRIPYTIQYGAGIEQQLNPMTSLFANYVGARGIDMFRSIDANAPPPPIFSARPNPNLGQERQMQSEGSLKSNAMEIGLRGRPAKFLTGQARYNLGKTYNDTSGIRYFPANSYAPQADWSRSDNDQRHKFDMLASFEAGKYFSFGTALSTYSGKPVNITTGNDENRDGLALDRPAGTPRNTMHGPAYIGLDLNLAHDFPFTREGNKGPTATLTLNSFNVLNHANDMTYIGVVGSPFFGSAVAAQPPRRMQLNVEFKF